MSERTTSSELRQLALVAENSVDRDAFVRAANTLDARDAEIKRLRHDLVQILGQAQCAQNNNDVNARLLHSIADAVNGALNARTALAAADMAAWRPISEAPKDGRELDLRFPNPYGGPDMVHVGAWHSGESVWKAIFKTQGEAVWHRGDCQPTHFRYRSDD